MCVCVYVCVPTRAHVGPAPLVSTPALGGLGVPWWHPGTGRVDTIPSDPTPFAKMVPPEDELGRLWSGLPPLAVLWLRVKRVRTGTLAGVQFTWTDGQL